MSTFVHGDVAYDECMEDGDFAEVSDIYVRYARGLSGSYDENGKIYANCMLAIASRESRVTMSLILDSSSLATTLLLIQFCGINSKDIIIPQISRKDHNEMTRRAKNLGITPQISLGSLHNYMKRNSLRGVDLIWADYCKVYRRFTDDIQYFFKDIITHRLVAVTYSGSDNDGGRGLDIKLFNAEQGMKDLEQRLDKLSGTAFRWERYGQPVKYGNREIWFAIYKITKRAQKKKEDDD